MTQWETFGAVLAVVASIVSNLGVNIQKYSHAHEARIVPVSAQRPYVNRPLWWVGLALVMLGSLGDFTAFGFATQSLVAALGGGATLVSNVFIAYFLNKESLYKTDLGGVLFVIIGVVVIAWIAEPNAEYPLPELEERFVRTEFLVYIITVGVSVVSMLATIKGSAAHRLKSQINGSKARQKQRMRAFETRLQQLERRLVDMETQLLETTHAHVASTLLPRSTASRTDRDDSNSSDALGVADADSETVPSRVPYYYAICSGIIGAITVLLAKCSAIMIALTLKGENQFQYAVTYVFLGGMVVCILIQTHLLNLATSLGDIMTVFPIFQACWITFSVVGGAIFYDADRSMTTQELVLYPLALLSIGVGVALLVQHQSSARAAAAAAANDPTKGYKALATTDTDEVCVDASMRSPLLPLDADDHDGYLRLGDDSNSV